MVSLEFFIDIEMSIRNISLGVKAIGALALIRLA